MRPCIRASWINDVARANNIQDPLNPNLVNKIIQECESKVRSVIQTARTFQKRGKKKLLTVENVNQALVLNNQERIYGLGLGVESSLRRIGVSDESLLQQRVTSLEDYIANKQLPPIPLEPALSLHWLAVDGAQPHIEENPHRATLRKAAASEHESIPPTFSKEVQHFYSRLCNILLACDEHSLHAVYSVLRTDNGLQMLLPYLSRFLCLQVKKHMRSLHCLSVTVQAIRCIVFNPHIVLSNHLEQLMPALLTSVLGSKLSASPWEDHWALRRDAAETVARVCSKYRDAFPDLQAQVCKTYLKELRANKSAAGPVSFPSLFGSIVGLSALGHSVVRAVLLQELLELERVAGLVDTVVSAANGEDHSGEVMSEVRLRHERDRCLHAITLALGGYMVACLRLPFIPPAQTAGDSKKRRLQSGASHMDNALVSALGESLVPFYVNSCVSLDYCKLFI